jgi:hypothetical protein
VTRRPASRALGTAVDVPEGPLVIVVMTRLEVHHMAEGGTLQAAIAEKCSISVRSVERIVTEPVPTVDEVAVWDLETVAG